MSRTNDIARRQAADWLARLLASDANQRDHEAFERWCAGSEANADAYAAIAGDHDFARLLTDDPLIVAATQKARIAYQGRIGTGLGRWVSLAAAALVVVAAGAGAWRIYRNAGSAEVLATAIGEQRNVVLADGTRLVLDTNTRVDARLDRGARALVLREGRIDVDVARDPRPFSVVSGRGVVRDIGTRFEVERHGEDVAVTLMSGAVRVSLAQATDGAGEATLVPGQQARFGAAGGILVADAEAIDDAAAWTEGTLVFKQRRLGDLIAEVNRYSTVQIRLADTSLADVRVSGVFRVGDQASLLEALRAGWSISTKQTSEHEIELSRK
jgi:transmembrane sensor